MQTDNTYTPLRNDFNEVIAKVYPGGISDQQKETLREFFFAGATSAYAFLQANPDTPETIYDELVDKAYLWEGESQREPKVA